MRRLPVERSCTVCHNLSSCGTPLPGPPLLRALLASLDPRPVCPEPCTQYAARVTLTQLTQQPPPDVLAATQADGDGDAVQAEIWQVGVRGRARAGRT